MKEFIAILDRSNVKALLVLGGLVSLIIMVPRLSDAVPPGKIVEYYGGGTGKVIFDGKLHADKGLTCNKCHVSIFPMKRGMVTISMATMTAGDSCGTCHNGNAAFSSSECYRCHRSSAAGRSQGSSSNSRSVLIDETITIPAGNWYQYSWEFPSDCDSVACNLEISTFAYNHDVDVFVVNELNFLKFKAREMHFPLQLRTRVAQTTFRVKVPAGRHYLVIDNSYAQFFAKKVALKVAAVN